MLPAVKPYQRTPLCNLEIEQALLGLLLIHNTKFEEISDRVRPFHFHNAAHQKIYQVITQLADLNKDFSPLTLAQYLNESDLEAVGGRDYLAQLPNCFVSPFEATHYAKLIIDFHLRRELVNLNDSSLAAVYNLEVHQRAVDCLEQLEQKIFELSEKGTTTQDFFFTEIASNRVKEVEDNIKNQSASKGIETGFIDLDKSLGGLHPTNLLIIGGRPAMGKTALATNIAFNVAKAHFEGKPKSCPVAFFSLEMSKEELVDRILVKESKVSSDKLRKGILSLNELFLIGEVSDTYQNLPLIINDKAGMTISSLRARARILKRKHNIGLIVVDYLQLIESEKKSNNFVQDISIISKGLKNIAKELHIPVIALSQLSREVEKRDDKRPRLSDLRESGSIEQDADVVMFVFREEYYETSVEPRTGTEKHDEWKKRMDSIYSKAEVIIAKNRHGAVGTTQLFFDGNSTQFGNLEKDAA